MSELLDEQLLSRALVASADVRASGRPVARRRVRPFRLALALSVAVLLIAGSAVAAQRAVLEPFGVFVGSDSRYGNLGDREFVRQLNEGRTPPVPAIASAGLVLQSEEPGGDVRMYATTNADGSHGVAISEDGNPPGYACCTAQALSEQLHVGAQLSRSVIPVAYADVWAGWAGRGAVAVAVLYSDGTTRAALVDDGYFLAIDRAPPGARPIALVAYAEGGGELGRVAISRG